INRLEDVRRGECFHRARFEAFEGSKRGSMRRIARENLPVKIDCARNVIEMLLVELRDSILKSDGLVRLVAELLLVRQNAEQLRPVLRRLIQRIESPERSSVVRIELEHLRIGIDRLGNIS